MHRNKLVSCDRCGASGLNIQYIDPIRVSPYLGVMYSDKGKPIICTACEHRLTPFQYSHRGGPFMLPDVLHQIPKGWHKHVIQAFGMCLRKGWNGVLRSAPYVDNGRLSSLSNCIPPWMHEFRLALHIHTMLLNTELTCLCLCAWSGKALDPKDNDHINVLPIARQHIEHQDKLEETYVRKYRDPKQQPTRGDGFILVGRA